MAGVTKQLLRMWDVDGKLLSNIKRMYTDNLACVKGGWSDSLSNGSGVRQVCGIFSWLLNEYMDEVMKNVKVRRGEVKFLPDFLYAECLVLVLPQSEDNVEMIECFCEVCKTKKCE